MKIQYKFIQAAIDLWNVIRYMSQLPSDYTNNRISLPSQQAIVLSARSYLEYSYVFFCFFIADSWTMR
jgi:hypothetical protein